MGALYSPGLEGIVTAITSISDIEPEQGSLAYRGYDIHELAEQSTFEEVAFLLLYGRLPKPEEMKSFSNDLALNRDLPKELIELFNHLPPHTHPMDMLHAAVAFFGAVDLEARDLSGDALFRKVTRTIAKLPTMIAMGWRIAHKQEPISPLRQLTHTQNFLYMLSGYGPDADAVTALDRLLILYAEHESDVSSFTARVAASSFTDYHSAITAAIASLKGRLHGGESEQAMRMLQSISRADRAEEWIKDALRKKHHIMGFGHPVYKHGNACAEIMKSVSRELGEKTGDLSWHSLCETIEGIMLREQDLCHNIDFYAGPVLSLLSIPAELCTPIFAAGRIAGWSAHVIEQFDNNRLIRPRFEYRGPKHLSYSPFAARNNKAKVPSA